MNKKITEVTFSPGGTTQIISGLFCGYAGFKQTDKIDLLRSSVETKRFAPDEAVVVSMPVFSGRLPGVALERMQEFKGENTPAVALVVYGNRDYDDALLELKDLLEANGFQVAGAGAFLARHSIFPQVAKGRPDEKDREALRSFAQQCGKKIENGVIQPLQVKGSKPYRADTGSIPIYPTGNSSCTNCGLCSKICPTKAINANTPKKTDKEKCIRCTACIYNCPANARSFRGPLYAVAAAKFRKKCAEYREPEFFL